MTRHFLDISALSKQQLRAILDEAHRRKNKRIGWPKAKADEDRPLDGHALAMIWQGCERSVRPLITGTSLAAANSTTSW